MAKRILVVLCIFHTAIAQAKGLSVADDNLLGAECQAQVNGTDFEFLVFSGGSPNFFADLIVRKVNYRNLEQKRLFASKVSSVSGECYTNTWELKEVSEGGTEIHKLKVESCRNGKTGTYEVTPGSFVPVRCT